MIKQSDNTRAFAPLAQLDRASVYGTEGWGFELLMVRQPKGHAKNLRVFCVVCTHKEFLNPSR